MGFNLRARVVRSFQDAQQNFDQLAGELKYRSVSGAVDTSVASGSGDGFTFAQNAAGDVTVTFTPAFVAAPHVTTGLVDGSGGKRESLQGAPTVSSFRFIVTNADTPFALVNATMHFHARGLR